MISSSGQRRMGILGIWTPKTLGLQRFMDLELWTQCILEATWLVIHGFESWTLASGFLSLGSCHCTLFSDFKEEESMDRRACVVLAAPVTELTGGGPGIPMHICLTPKYWLYSQILMSVSLNVASILLNYYIILVGHL